MLIVAIAALVAGSLIAALVIATGGGKKSAAQVSATPTSVRSPLPPANLTSSINILAVTLNWTEPPGSTQVTRFNLYRDGAILASPTGTTYTDSSALPGQTYSYELEAVGATGASSRASVQVSVPVPSLAAARLEGDFNVKARTISHSGYASYPSSFTLGYHFDPKCAIGSCDVVWRDLSAKGFKQTFKERGARYLGTDSGDFNAVCGSAHHDSTLTISIRVVKAKALDDAWRASTLVGTIMQYDAAQLGCVTGRATISITLTLLG
jgi:hypothetical protein